jgi:hypothetical protein
MTVGMKARMRAVILLPTHCREIALDHRLVEQSVEKLCAKGCRSVWADIEALEAGQRLPEVEGLSREELALVIGELKSIMSVYEGSCAAV